MSLFTALEPSEQIHVMALASVYMMNEIALTECVPLHVFPVSSMSKCEYICTWIMQCKIKEKIYDQMLRIMVALKYEDLAIKWASYFHMTGKYVERVL